MINNNNNNNNNILYKILYKIIKMSLIYKKPKGTIDFFNDKYDKLVFYKNKLEKLFRENGGLPLETPTFELENILLNKYGEEAENKLIFSIKNIDINNENSEKYSLRYDLTIPLERFVIENGIKKLRRYSIGKVYRRDQPSVGRYREFYQADFDIIGEDNNDMINEFILLKMVNTFLQECNINNYKILINDTNNLKYMLINELNIDIKNFKNICQTIDKLDKYTFEEIKTELKSKDLDEIQISKLEKLVKLNEPINNSTIINYNKLKSYSNYFNFDDKLYFTSSLARGLDYYNGFIFEIKIDNFAPTIISGGRYDNLIPNTTMIGISFGLSRILDLLNYDINDWNETYYITTIGKIDFDIKLKILSFLETKLNIKIMLDSSIKTKKFIKELNYCIENKIRYIFVIAENEYMQNKIILKDLKNKTQELLDI